MWALILALLMGGCAYPPATPGPIPTPVSTLDLEPTVEASVEKRSIEILASTPPASTNTPTPPTGTRTNGMIPNSPEPPTTVQRPTQIPTSVPTQLPTLTLPPPTTVPTSIFHPKVEEELFTRGSNPTELRRLKISFYNPLDYPIDIEYLLKVTDSDNVTISAESNWQSDIGMKDTLVFFLGGYKHTYDVKFTLVSVERSRFPPVVTREDVTMITSSIIRSDNPVDYRFVRLRNNTDRHIDRIPLKAKFYRPDGTFYGTICCVELGPLEAGETRQFDTPFTDWYRLEGNQMTMFLYFVGTESITIAKDNQGREETQPPPQEDGHVQTKGLIDLNTASVNDLVNLPGIGPVKAKAIIDYREQKGPFKTAAEVTTVSGIGPATYENIKNLITVGSE
jgi:comEA protein